MPSGVRVAVIDDHPLFREGVSSIFSRSDQHKLIALGADADDALRIAKEHLPDVLLLDISLPGGGLNAVRAISEMCPVVKVVMLTSSESESDVSTALSSGASGYILKGIGGRELLAAVESIHGGATYVSPNLAMRLLKQMQRRNETPNTAHDICSLTEREEEILGLVAEGLTNKEVARECTISEKTVKHYMTNIMQKLHVRNRVEAAIIGRARRMVS